MPKRALNVLSWHVFEIEFGNNALVSESVVSARAC